MHGSQHLTLQHQTRCVVLYGKAANAGPGAIEAESFTKRWPNNPHQPKALMRRSLRLEKDLVPTGQQA